MLKLYAVCTCRIPLLHNSANKNNDYNDFDAIVVTGCKISK
jgi:hypothetical protein